jgi:hypothetical protein
MKENTADEIYAAQLYIYVYRKKILEEKVNLKTY